MLYRVTNCLHTTSVNVRCCDWSVALWLTLLLVDGIRVWRHGDIVAPKMALVMPYKLQLQNGDLNSNVQPVGPRTCIRQHIHS